MEYLNDSEGSLVDDPPFKTTLSEVEQTSAVVLGEEYEGDKPNKSHFRKKQKRRRVGKKDRWKWFDLYSIYGDKFEKERGRFSMDAGRPLTAARGNTRRGHSQDHLGTLRPIHL